MNAKLYRETLLKEIAKISKVNRFDFWNHQDTFKISNLDDIVEHGMSEEFTPQQLADRLFEVATPY